MHGLRVARLRDEAYARAAHAQKHWAAGTYCVRLGELDGRVIVANESPQVP